MKLTNSINYSKISLWNIYIMYHLVTYFFINKFDKEKIINHLDETKIK
jgi:hypothetical protein